MGLLLKVHTEWSIFPALSGNICSKYLALCSISFVPLYDLYMVKATMMGNTELWLHVNVVIA